MMALSVDRFADEIHQSHSWKPDQRPTPRAAAPWCLPSVCLGRSRVSAGQFGHGDEEQERSLFKVHEQRPLGCPANAIANGLLAEVAERESVSDLLNEVVAVDRFHAPIVATSKRHRDPACPRG